MASRTISLPCSGEAVTEPSYRTRSLSAFTLYLDEVWLSKACISL